jgi:hypothetical protein
VTTNQANQNYTGNLIPITITGFALTENSVGISGVAISFSNGGGNVTTGTSGEYTITLPQEYTGTASPAKTGYTFEPAQRVYTDGVPNPPGSNYIGSLMTFTVSGTITDDGIGLSGVELDGFPADTTTDALGHYSCPVSYGWSGTVVPVLSGYTFIPANRVYPGVTADLTEQNYAANQVYYTISGEVADAGVGLSEVVLQGFPETTITDASGIYSCPVPQGWSGTVVPELTGYTFTPVNREYSDVASDLTEQNYAANQIFCTISGTVYVAGGGLGEVLLQGFPSTTITNAIGAYSCQVQHGWSGTVTPVKDGYTFSPVTREYPDTDVDLNNQDYIAYPIIHAISGNISLNGTGLMGVSLVGFPQACFTDNDGDYSCTVTYGWTGVVTPQKAGYSFSPPSRSYNDVSDDFLDQNYESAVGNIDQVQTPAFTKLLGAYPNPFNPSTTIRFSLTESAAVTILVYNTRGDIVKRLVAKNIGSGFHEIVWNGTDDSGREVASGIYYSVMRAGVTFSSIKIALVK